MKKYIYVLLGIFIIFSIFIWNNIFSVLALDENPTENDLISLSDFEHIWGFTFNWSLGVSDLNYTSGKFAVNSLDNTLYIWSHVYQNAIAQYEIPVLKINNDTSKLNKAKQLQNFSHFLNKTDNTEKHDRLGWFVMLWNKLLVHTFGYYDAAAKNIKTSSLIENPLDLAKSEITWMFKLSWKAHLVSWTSLIPAEWQKLLWGDYIAGSSNSVPINSRASMWPSAFVLKSDSILNNTDITKTINTTALLDFNLNHIFSKEDKWWSEYGKWDSYNSKWDNDIWTEASWAEYWLIIPWTRTYATFGYSWMHETGWGYKITQIEGKTCWGPCAKSAKDYYNYYWLWDVNDFVDVKNGIKKPYEVKPYEYGKFNIPNWSPYHLISWGSYDSVKNILYLNLPKAHKQWAYSNIPVIHAFKINNVVDNIGPILSNVTPVWELEYTITKVNISFYTNEVSTCKYSLSPNQSYSEMKNVLLSTSNNFHSVEIDNLIPSSSYVYYVKCSDQFNNENTVDTEIKFSIKKLDIESPILTNILPKWSQPANTANISLSFDTSEISTCKYSMKSGETYSEMLYTINNINGIQHSVYISKVINWNNYTYYVKCSDQFNNENTVDTVINFSINNKVEVTSWWSGWWSSNNNLPRCIQEDLVCKSVNWSNANGIYYKLPWKICAYGLYSTKCIIKDAHLDKDINISTDTDFKNETNLDKDTKNDSNNKIDNSTALDKKANLTNKNRYYKSKNKNINNLEEKIDKLILKKNKHNNEITIKYRNIFIENLEKYIDLLNTKNKSTKWIIKTKIVKNNYEKSLRILINELK